MKIDLTITDMNPEEFAQIFAKFTTVEPVVSKNDITDVATEVDTATIDKDGLQWDARIHSSNHKMNSDGRWQRRRGVTDAEFNTVKNELLGTQEPVAESVPAPVEAPAPVAEPVIAPVIAPAPLAAPEPVVAPAPQPVQAPVSPVADSAVLYNTMFEKLRVGMTNGKVDPNYIKDLVTTLNNTLGTQYQSIALIKDDITALQFVINDLTTRGL